VDEGIAPVVVALNQFPRLYTTQSCEGRDDGTAFVWFRYGETVHEAADFLVWLSRNITVPGVRVLAEWGGGAEVPTLRLELRIAHRAIDDLAGRLRELSADRTSACSCDTERTESGS
jgi:hypothetical protein